MMTHFWHGLLLVNAFGVLANAAASLGNTIAILRLVRRVAAVERRLP